MDKAFADEPPQDLNETHAALIIKGGKLIYERYWKGYGPEDTYKSWSMAKSITQALVGILQAQGKIHINDKAEIKEWQGTPREDITLDQLLRMSSGLHFVEDYVDGEVSHVIEMLFGEGQHDVAGYAASLDLAHTPDSVHYYSSGTTNIVTRLLHQASGLRGEEFRAFMEKELFHPIGIRSADPRFDSQGTFIGSSFCFCTARDFAKFGLLYMRDGVWDGTRILPEGWVDYARTPTTTEADHEDLDYGAHWWLGIAGPNSFSANGYQGQYIVCEPELDLIVVRHGDSIGDDLSRNLRRWIAEVVDCFR